jgi:uncharacterized membrane protein
MIDPIYALTIALMATVTYTTRIGGYILLRNRTISDRMKAVMECAPGCVLITVIAPDFVTGRPADLVALVITLLAATRLPILPTVVTSIAAAGLLRQILG